MAYVIDGFNIDPYSKTLQPSAPTDTHDTPVRETVFSIGGGALWDQPIKLEIGPHHGNGILIVNSGFGSTAGLVVNYGTFRQHGGAPLSLPPLSAYSAFRLQFQGFATSVSMNVTMEVSGPGGPNWAFEKVPTINDNPFSLDFPFSGFTDNHVDFGLPESVLSDIAGFFLEFEPDAEASFGITSFEAVP
jgi:hypothetical protein